MDSLSQMNVADYSAALAADLAADLYEREVVFKNHGMSMAQGLELLAQPWFKAMVDQAKRDWDALDNVKDRIKTKAQIALEDSIPTVYGIIADKTTPGAARVAAFKEMKEIAGMGAKESEGQGQVFVPIQIFLDGREAPPLVFTPGNPSERPGGAQRQFAGGELEEEVEDGVVVDPAVVTRAVMHAAAKGDTEPCFVLGMGVEEDVAGSDVVASPRGGRR